MLHKVFASLPHTTFPPLKQFPKVTLQANANYSLRIPQADLQIPPEVAADPSCPIVEVRSAVGNRHQGLAFFDANSEVAEGFYVTNLKNPQLPVVDDAYFASLIDAAQVRRRTLISKRTTCYRAIHGAHDCLPSLLVDHYCASFCTVRCNSLVGERLIVIAAQFFRERGAEQLLIESPSVPLQRVVLTRPTVTSVKDTYQEEGIQFMWMPPDVDPTSTDRWLLNLEFRRARRMVRDISAGKRVLCLYDRAGGMTMNACLTAKHVAVVEPQVSARDRIRDTIVMNHGSSVLGKLVTTYGSLPEAVDGARGNRAARSPATSIVYDVVTVELDATTHGLPIPWETLVGALSANGLLVVQWKTHGTLAAETSTTTVSGISEAVGRAAASQGRLSWLVSSHTEPSVDFPVNTLMPVPPPGGASSLGSFVVTIVVQ